MSNDKIKKINKKKKLAKKTHDQNNFFLKIFKNFKNHLNIK